ncbi:hypothetical protein D9Q98_009044 [Chlorella vulgaris]|uniref:Uncharacterized protein n=1 Tax=Chlorella vulgaris TaxID=3077 RepID=A0A9D4TH29_CHLVU|nr:hypothetical protein D9Q98_009044 [Chlorella vulgaris]
METPPLTASAQLLQERFSLVVEHHKAELQRSAVEQQNALRELSSLRHQGEQRTTQLQHQHDNAVAALQRRFEADVQALRERLRRDLTTAASQADSEWRAGTHPPLLLESSSEFDPGSYFSDTDDSNGGEGLESRRSSPVKSLAPPGLDHAAGSGSSTPRTMSHACLPASDSRPGSARQAGGTSCGSGSMRSAALRAYSPCTCQQGLGLRTASGSSGWLRGADILSD